MSEKKERVLTNTKSVSFVYERKEESERERKKEREKERVSDLLLKFEILRVDFVPKSLLLGRSCCQCQRICRVIYHNVNKIEQKTA